MGNYICNEIPTPDFDACFDSELVIALLEEEEMIPLFPDHYPNIRVDALEDRVTEAEQDVANKVDKIIDKGLSTNDLTNELKTSYDSAVNHAGSDHAPSDAEKNVQADWNQADNTADDFIKNKPTIPAAATRDSLGLDTDDSPEFANTLITPLQSDAVSGGVIPVAEATWLGATAKSVLSYIAAIVHYLYTVKDAIIFATPRLNQALTGAILLDRCITQYNNLTLTGALELSVGANPTVEGSAEGVIIGNGTNTPTLNGITLWPTSASFDATNLKQNHFMVWKQGDGVYIAWTQKN